MKFQIDFKYTAGHDDKLITETYSDVLVRWSLSANTNILTLDCCKHISFLNKVEK